MTRSVCILTGDNRLSMQLLDDKSVQCCVTSPPYYGLRSYLPDGHQDKPSEIGFTGTPDEYVAEMVDVFREVRRVLRDDGTLWLNLGDSYSDKNRLMIPARVALALQSDGWIIRDEIIWHKPRTTPAPVKDRTVAAHEMVYLLTKSRKYFYDYLAIEEPSKRPGQIRKVAKAFRDLQAADPKAAAKRPGNREITVRDTRRSRSVWYISPQPYRGAHSATMPVDLAEQCIRAGSRPGDTVLDPFGGAGTTGVAAVGLGRDVVLTELNPEYVTLAEARILASPHT